MMTTAQLTTRTLNVPDATLVYDIRPKSATSQPALLLIGSPMGATDSPRSAATSRTAPS